VEIKAVLSDGSSAIFKEITAEFIEKTKGTRSKVRSTRPFMRNFRILKTKRDYQGISETRIHRRNTGYAIDLY
jgi:hypothetical protein